MYTFVSIGDLSTSVFNANDWVEGQGEADWSRGVKSRLLPPVGERDVNSRGDEAQRVSL